VAVLLSTGSIYRWSAADRNLKWENEIGWQDFRPKLEQDGNLGTHTLSSRNT
jgi:hypothetical protein